MPDVTFLIEKHQQKRPDLIQAFYRESIDSLEAVGIWFFTIFFLAVMGLTIHLSAERAPLLFYLILTYATAISLILSAPVHSMFTRKLLDDIFLGNIQLIVNGLITASLLLILMALPLSALPVFLLSTVPLNLKIGFVTLTTFLSLFWCINSVLSALQKERVFLWLFLGSMGLVLLLFLLGRPETTRPPALVLIFSLGIAIPVAGGYGYMIRFYVREPIRMDWSFLKRRESMKPGLSLFFFSLGLWIDKFIFWFSPRTGEIADPLFHYAVEYDYPFFLALTTMMIGSVLVYRGIKRRVTTPYKAFLFKLEHNFPFRDLAIEKHALFYGIGHVAATILMVYGGIVLYILFILYLRWVPLPWKNPFTFHYLLLGTVFFALYTFYFLILQYLDDFDGLLRVTFLFLLLNTAATLLSILLGPAFYGTGFTAAAIVSAIYAFTKVNAKVGGLEFEVFRKALGQSRS